MLDEVVSELTRRVAASFRTVGRDSGSTSFIGKCLAGSETAFSAGVPVREVVEFTLRAAADMAPEADPVPTREGLDNRLIALGHELRRFDDAMAMVRGFGCVRGQGGEAARWVADAVVTEGVRTIRRAVEETLRDLVVLVHGDAPPAGAGLGTLLDMARGDARRQGILLPQTTHDLRMLGDPVPERAGDDLRFSSRHLDGKGEAVSDAAHAYVRQARRATLVAATMATRDARQAG